MCQERERERFWRRAAIELSKPLSLSLYVTGVWMTSKREREARTEEEERN
jgi:hypothetical protein